MSESPEPPVAEEIAPKDVTLEQTGKQGDVDQTQLAGVAPDEGQPLQPSPSTPVVSNKNKSNNQSLAMISKLKAFSEL